MFKWVALWGIVHTGCVPNGIVVSCVRQDRAVAWAVFHCSGMFGTVEALAESIGACSRGFPVCEHCALRGNHLRSAGSKGAGRSGEDGVLEL